MGSEKRGDPSPPCAPPRTTGLSTNLTPGQTQPPNDALPQPCHHRLYSPPLLGPAPENASTECI
jgi:hypothetical protein